MIWIGNRLIYGINRFLGIEMHMSSKDYLLRQAMSYRNDLTAYAYGLTRNWSMAQDAYQEALIAINKKIDKLSKSEIFPWLKRVTRNKAIDLIRKQESMNKTRMHLIELVDTHFERELNEESSETRKFEDAALYNCMSKLRTDARKLILFFYKDGKSCVDLSRIFKRSENALRLLLSRTRSSLRNCVKKEMSLHE